MSGTDDLGRPVSYLALAEGTAVLGSDGEEVGHVAHVLADEEQDIFDGIVIAHAPGPPHLCRRRADRGDPRERRDADDHRGGGGGAARAQREPRRDAGRPFRAGRLPRWATSCAARGTCSPATTEGRPMKAIVWHGPERMAIEERPEPRDPGAGRADRPPRGGRHLRLGGRGLPRAHGQPHAPAGHGPRVRGRRRRGRRRAPAPGTGARVAVNPLAGCGHCRLCRAGQENLCPRRTLIGVHHDGAFADLVTRAGGQRARAARRRARARRRAGRAAGQRRARGAPRAGRRAGVAQRSCSAPARSGS